MGFVEPRGDKHSSRRYVLFKGVAHGRLWRGSRSSFGRRECLREEVEGDESGKENDSKNMTNTPVLPDEASRLWRWLFLLPRTISPVISRAASLTSITFAQIARSCGHFPV